MARASNPAMSVSSTGLALENLRPLSRFSTFTRLSTSRASAIRLVEQRMWEFRPPTPLTVTCTLLSSQGASTYTSSMRLSDSNTSNIPMPTECR